jgi:3-oxoacyl-[acyl-carrier protein] reductase
VFIHFFRQAIDSQSEPESGADLDTPGLPFYYAMQTRSAEEVVESIRAQGGRAASREANLAELGVVPDLFDEAEKAFGPVEILVNNAADYQADTFTPPQSLEQEDRSLWAEGPLTSTITADSHDRHFAVNTRAAALMMAEFARRHVARQQRWGRIINVSADCSAGCPAEVSYRASKHALESYSRGAAAELGPLGITVNIVSPGPVQTGYMTPQMIEALIGDIPLRRVGEPRDIADAIVFLASDQARWITGQLLCVHGGHRMALGP